FESFAAHTGNGDVVTPAERIEGNEHFDFVFVGTFLKKVLHTAKITRAFFTDVPDKKNIACGLDLCRIKGPDNLQEDRQCTRIIADARSKELRTFTTNFHVRTFRKDGIEVRSDRDQGTITCSSSDADDIAFHIDVDVRQPTLPEHLRESSSPFFFLKRRRLD